jgi:hypothetical protein
MGSYLREVHTVGIHLRHWERLAGGQFGCVQWLGFHEVEFIMSVRRRSNSQLPAWSLKSLPISIFSRRLGEPCLYPVNVTRIQASRTSRFSFAHFPKGWLWRPYRLGAVFGTARRTANSNSLPSALSTWALPFSIATFTLSLTFSGISSFLRIDTV